MKANISKPTMINMLVNAWGVIRIILHHDVSISGKVQRDLKTYFIVMQKIEDQSIGEVDFENDSDINATSLKMPPEEKFNGWLQNGAVPPLSKHRKCPCCGMLTTHYPANHETIKEQRKKMTAEWKTVYKQYVK